VDLRISVKLEKLEVLHYPGVTPSSSFSKTPGNIRMEDTIKYDHILQVVIMPVTFFFTYGCAQRHMELVN
jgi:hypothetical protein